MRILCEECFPDGEKHEMYCIVTSRPCELCGKTDDRYNGGLKVHYLVHAPRLDTNKGKHD
jgi:hypothetical protein